MGEWQPIETAPKDGTPILTWTSGIEIEHDPYLVLRFIRGHWTSEELNDTYFPEFWMPLPSPPEGT